MVPSFVRSKGFWAFALGGGSFAAAIARDRFLAHQLHVAHMDEARKFGAEPLADTSRLRQLKLFLLASSDAEATAIRECFRRHVVELLTVAGVDYKWVVVVDGEGAARVWNSAAQEANEPELMLESGGPAAARIAPDELRDGVLASILQRQVGEMGEDDKRRSIWKKLQRHYNTDVALHEGPASSHGPVPPHDGFVSFNSLTRDALINVLATDLPVETPVPPPASWLSRLFSRRPASISIPPSPPAIILLAHVPCDHSQNMWPRFRRFCFGQRELTERIEGAVMTIIRDRTRQRIQSDKNDGTLLETYVD